ncbi:PREDICTED: uncharacterized protein LOC101315241 [Fragaria vesca subsp. vesca]|uniref:uncharacterized protein LOC101315241 n=1 Tax=Fragaria vesca subsp. vesca TaxID=101020 RepID=UPI0002C2ECE1|nr:PREDICTED: uncharacterized protein LOC101315241 [Fragaria vesca subsp. vesca]
MFISKQVKQSLYISVSLALVIIVVPLFLSLNPSAPDSKQEKTPMATNAFGVKVEKNPTQSQLTELGVTTWPKWECGPSKFPWSFTATETMYLLKGKVNVEVDGHEGSFEIGAGDLVVFPKGMKVTWDVIEGVNKHYSLEK